MIGYWLNQLYSEVPLPFGDEKTPEESDWWKIY